MEQDPNNLNSPLKVYQRALEYIVDLGHPTLSEYALGVLAWKGHLQDPHWLRTYWDHGVKYLGRCIFCGQWCPLTSAQLQGSSFTDCINPECGTFLKNWWADHVA